MSRVDEQFRDAMRFAGLDYAGPVVADGKLHRFKTDGDHARNSWYILHEGPPAAGAFGCWKRQINETWCDRTCKQLSMSEREGIRRHIQKVEAERARFEKMRHRKARKITDWILSRATPADPSHPYLTTKRINPHGELRQRGDKLVLPLREADGTLSSLQFIGPDGFKKFLPGGRIQGCMSILVDEGTGPLVICEGYATGASIIQATGMATIAALNCGNLLAVAKALRAKCPEREIVVAADNDAFTTDKDGRPNNPGIEKGREAALAIGARIAIPQFKDIKTKPTDYNDLANLEGLDAVKTQIENATNPKEADPEIFARLAKLTPTEYDRAREAEAKKLGIRIATLDREVEQRREMSGGGSTLQGQSVDFQDVEPWPEPVDGARVLAEIAATFGKYIVLPDGAADASALWVGHTHAFKTFLCSPRLNIMSPEKGCGKTVMRDVVAVLVPHPLLTENLTVAVLFRLVEAHSPVILADEYDAWLSDNEELRGLLNAGHRRGAMVYRCEGDRNEVRAFAAYAPAALCGIGALPGTLHDRSIVIKLVRAKKGEIRARFDSRHTEHETELRRKLARWCADNLAQIESCDPVLPDDAFNRLADNWRPLFAIAEIAGGDWPERAAAAFAKLTSQEDTDAQGIGTMLLTDIKVVFDDHNKDRIFSKDLVEKLRALTDRPWGEIRKGHPVSEAWVAHRLRAFGVTSRKIRIGEETRQGYFKESFTEAWERYIPTPGETKRNTGTEPANIGENADSETEHASNLFHSEKVTSPNKNGVCSTVPLAPPPNPPPVQPALVEEEVS